VGVNRFNAFSGDVVLPRRTIDPGGASCLIFTTIGLITLRLFL
jgi:hypothetical protein